MSDDIPPARDIAPAKLNLALHVRALRPDGRHEIETLYVFCAEGDRLAATNADELTLAITGPFAAGLGQEDNLVMRAARALQAASGCTNGAAIVLDKRLPIASGLGGGSADAGAALRLLTALWDLDPAHAVAVAPQLGADVPACLLSLPAIGRGAGDALRPVDPGELGVSGTPVLLVNPRVELSTSEVFDRWDGRDHGPLGDWRHGRNDLEPAARAIVPQIDAVLAFLSTQPGATITRMSGSGATCFALFESEGARDSAENHVPREWWRLATSLR